MKSESLAQYRTRAVWKARQLQKQQAQGKFLDRRERRAVQQLIEQSAAA